MKCLKYKLTPTLTALFFSACTSSTKEHTASSQSPTSDEASSSSIKPASSKAREFVPPRPISIRTPYEPSPYGFQEPVIQRLILTCDSDYARHTKQSHIKSTENMESIPKILNSAAFLGRAYKTFEELERPFVTTRILREGSQLHAYTDAGRYAPPGLLEPYDMENSRLLWSTPLTPIDEKIARSSLQGLHIARCGDQLVLNTRWLHSTSSPMAQPPSMALYGEDDLNLIYSTTYDALTGERLGSKSTGIQTYGLTKEERLANERSFRNPCSK